MDNVRKEIIEYYHNNLALLNDIIGLWHDGVVGRDQELHDYLGITLEEYGYILNYDYFSNRHNYIDFMDYINRNCEVVDNPNN